jgi:hypothetical protein
MSSRLVRILAAITTATAVPAALVALSAVPSSATTYDSSGSVTFQGAVSGTLKVSASLNSGGLPGCSISGLSKSGATEGATIVIVWNNVKLKIGAKAETLSFVELSTDVADFGKSYSMNEDVDVHAGVTLSMGTTSYSSVSGTATTAKSGVSGSDNGELKSSGSSLGEVKVSARWAGCAQPRT